jgi:hypothetical protein
VESGGPSFSILASGPAERRVAGVARGVGGASPAARRAAGPEARLELSARASLPPFSRERSGQSRRAVLKGGSLARGFHNRRAGDVIGIIAASPWRSVTAGLPSFRWVLREPGRLVCTLNVQVLTALIKAVLEQSAMLCSDVCGKPLKVIQPFKRSELTFY